MSSDDGIRCICKKRTRAQLLSLGLRCFVTKRRVLDRVTLLSHGYDELCIKLKLCKRRLQTRLKVNDFPRILQQHDKCLFLSFNAYVVLFNSKLSVNKPKLHPFFCFICPCFALLEFTYCLYIYSNRFAFLVYAVKMQFFVHIIKYYFD